jgi:hypothetical protein
MTNLLTIHVKRVTIQTKDMQLLNNLRHNMTKFDILFIIFYKQILNRRQITNIIQTKIITNLI